MNALSTFAQILAVFKQQQGKVIFPADCVHSITDFVCWAILNEDLKEKLAKTTNYKQASSLFPDSVVHAGFVACRGSSPSSCGCSFTWRGCFWAVTPLPAETPLPLQQLRSKVGKTKLAAPLFSKHRRVPQTQHGSSSSSSHRLPGWGKISFIYVLALIGFNI